MSDQPEIVERVARGVRLARFERNGKSATYDPSLPLHRRELADARAALTASGLSEALEENRRLREALEAYADIIDGTNTTGFTPTVEQMLLDLTKEARKLVEEPNR